MSVTDPSSTTGEPAVRVERRGPALWLYLNRPASLNGISLDIVDGLDAGLTAASRDDDIHAVVIAAVGRVFCAGADLKYVLQMTGSGDSADSARRLHAEFTSRVNEIFDKIEQYPKPVLAAVQGLALAGGLELALAVDIVIASESARFGDGHANYGLLPGAGGSVRLPRRVGASTAKRLMFTGASLPAGELLHTDLVSQVVADADLETAVADLVDTIATKSPLGLAVMKQLVNTSADVDLAQALEAESIAVRAHLQSSDFSEGIRAFNEKRQPNFQGR